MLKKFSFLVISLSVVFSSFSVSFGSPIDRLKQEMHNQTAEEIGWGILGPALRIIAIVFFILSIIAIVGAVGYLLIRGVKMIFGKGTLGKTELSRAAIVLLIGILVSGGSWFSLLELGNKVIVDPVNTQIIETEGTQETNSNETDVTQETNSNEN